ncbi:DUF1616 domain-containing protein [Halobacterium zhouii]|uniref:DUF1616 domain-containing protein n=1 Tax=Halobacterium zhouii TaxID=2902624 RepID=UPI001E35D3FD|nr:DUF1616 domain-containing protein [Halobacterium zhouii]
MSLYVALAFLPDGPSTSAIPLRDARQVPMSEEHAHGQWTSTVRRWSASLTDLLVVVAYVAVADAVLIDDALSPAVRAMVGFPLLLFVPGYVLLAGLFPRDAPARRVADNRLFAAVSEGALRPGERVLLAFGVSVALLPPFGIALSVLDLGWEPATVVSATTAALFVGVAAAAARRLRIPEGERFAVSATGSLSGLVGMFSGSRMQTTSAVVLVAVALLTTTSLAYALVAPAGGDAYTTVGLYTENETGELVTAGYPTTLTPNETGSVVVVVENHENRRVNYTLVGEIQRVERANGNVTVLESVRLNRSTHALAPGEKWQTTQTVRPELAGSDLRVAYLLYRGTPPADAGTGDAYRSVYFSLDVPRNRTA